MLSAASFLVPPRGDPGVPGIPTQAAKHIHDSKTRPALTDRAGAEKLHRFPRHEITVGHSAAG